MRNAWLGFAGLCYCVLRVAIDCLRTQIRSRSPSRLFAAKSSTAIACSRVTPSKPSRKSSSDSPAASESKRFFDWHTRFEEAGDAAHAMGINPDKSEEGMVGGNLVSDQMLRIDVRDILQQRLVCEHNYRTS